MELFGTIPHQQNRRGLKLDEEHQYCIQQSAPRDVEDACPWIIQV
jgi:hypothetical protein